MKKTMITLSAAVVALAGLSSVAMASNSASAPSKGYITLGAGYASTNVGDVYPTLGGTLLPKTGYENSSDGLFAKVGVGYNINSTFAIEADYLRLPAVAFLSKTNDKNNTKEQTNVFTSGNDIALLAKITYPVSDKVSVVGGVGAAYAMYVANNDSSVKINDTTVNGSDTTSTIVPMFTGGIQYKVSDKVGFGVNVDYTMAEKAIPEMLGGDFSVNYNF